MIHWITGCSAFNNRNWKGIFYPEKLPQRTWFDYYCSQFNSYEMNGTFYNFPSVDKLKSWYAKAPAAFTYSVKAPRIITHLKRFKDCGELTAGFYNTCKAGLGEKLGCVLFQLPPSFDYTEEKMELVISHLDKGFTNVVEFRHPSWWQQKVYDELGKQQVVFCSISYPGLPAAIINNTSIIYIRLHGDPQLYYSGYAAAALQALQASVESMGNVRQAFVYFNNTAAPAGVINAQPFRNLVDTGITFKNA